MDSTLTNIETISVYDADLEAGLIGCIVKNTDNWHEAVDRGISEEWFMEPFHIEIITKIFSEDAKGNPIDDVSIMMAFENEKRINVMEVFDRIETTAQFGKFLNDAENLWLKRQTIQTCHKVLQNAHENGSRAIDVIGHAGNEFSKLDLKDKTKLKTSAEVVRTTWEGILERQKDGGISGVPSGLRQLDSMTSGFKKAELITLAARTSVGKTAFAIELTLGALRAKKTVQFFSVEMLNESVMERMLANVSGVPVRVMVDKVMTQGQVDAVENAKEFLSSSPLFMEDAGDMTIRTIRARAQKLAREGLDMIVVDYCQIVTPDDPRLPREQQVSSITWGLKNLAKELKIPIVMLSQVNRNADGTNQCPRLSDLADSDKVGRDADVVLMLWKKQEKEGDKTFVEVAKQRNGRLGPIEVDFKASIQKFEESVKPSLN